MYFHYKQDNDVPGVSGLYGPQGPVGRINEKEYYTLLHTKQVAQGQQSLT